MQRGGPDRGSALEAPTRSDTGIAGLLVIKEGLFKRPGDPVKGVAESFSGPRLRCDSLRALGEAPERSNLHRTPQVNRQIGQ